MSSLTALARGGTNRTASSALAELTCPLRSRVKTFLESRPSRVAFNFGCSKALHGPSWPFASIQTCRAIHDQVIPVCSELPIWRQARMHDCKVFDHEMQEHARSMQELPMHLMIQLLILASCWATKPGDPCLEGITLVRGIRGCTTVESIYLGTSTRIPYTVSVRWNG